MVSASIGFLSASVNIIIDNIYPAADSHAKSYLLYCKNVKIKDEEFEEIILSEDEVSKKIQLPKTPSKARKNSMQFEEFLVDGCKYFYDSLISYFI